MKTQATRVILIDEVSMVSADLLGAQQRVRERERERERENA